MDPADGRHQVYTMDVWNHWHCRLKSWNQLIFSSWAFRHHLSFLLITLTAHNLCCLYARIDCAQCRSRMEWTSSADVCAMTLDNAIAAVSLLHACPWSLEPSRAVVNIHMLSIHRSRLQCCTPWHNSPSVEAIERRGAGKKAWKGAVRRLRPKDWQRTKCTFEECTFAPSWGSFRNGSFQKGASSVCAPLCCKHLCCASRFCMGGRELGAADPRVCLQGTWSKC